MDHIITSLHISRLCVYAYHGVMPQEQTVGANFYISVDANIDCAGSALQDDNIEGTVNYAEVVEYIKEEMAIKSQLLESLAYRIGRKLLSKFKQMQDIRLLIEKENPPMGTKCEGAGISIYIKR